MWFILFESRIWPIRYAHVSLLRPRGFHRPEVFGLMSQGLVNDAYPVCKVTKDIPKKV